MFPFGTQFGEHLVDVHTAQVYRDFAGAIPVCFESRLILATLIRASGQCVLLPTLPAALEPRFQLANRDDMLDFWYPYTNRQTRGRAEAGFGES